MKKLSLEEKSYFYTFFKTTKAWQQSKHFIANAFCCKYLKLYSLAWVLSLVYIQLFFRKISVQFCFAGQVAEQSRLGLKTNSFVFWFVMNLTNVAVAKRRFESSNQLKQRFIKRASYNTRLYLFDTIAQIKYNDFLWHRFKLCWFTIKDFMSTNNSTKGNTLV